MANPPAAPAAATLGCSMNTGCPAAGEVFVTTVARRPKKVARPQASSPRKLKPSCSDVRCSFAIRTPLSCAAERRVHEPGALGRLTVRGTGRRARFRATAGSAGRTSCAELCVPSAGRLPRDRSRGLVATREPDPTAASGNAWPRRSNGSEASRRSWTARHAWWAKAVRGSDETRVLSHAAPNRLNLWCYTIYDASQAEQPTSPAGAACKTLAPRRTSMAAPVRCSDRPFCPQRTRLTQCNRLPDQK